MNKEEIQKLFKDNPIKVIKYDDIEIPVEYLKQTTVNIDGKKYIQLQQENQQLKEIEKEHQRINGELREELQKANDTLDTHNELINHLQEVIEEVREYIEDWLFNVGGNGASMTYEDINELLQILDKGADK